MTPEELTKKVAEFPSRRAAARALGIPESTLRRRIKGVSTVEPLPDHAFRPSLDQLPDTHIGNDGVKTEDWGAAEENRRGPQRYIFTSAQNNTQVHHAFLANLEALAAEISAKLVVSFNVYDQAGYRGLVVKGDRKRHRRELWWDKAVQPYVVNHRVIVAPQMTFCGELDILATAKRPLSGMESYCRRSSIIIPHNRLEFRCVETRKGHFPKEMHTTGACTVRNFIQRKTGQLAAFHHVLGALLVEVQPETGYFYVHHLNATEDGAFYWLDQLVRDGHVEVNPNGIEAIILGDVHHEKKDPAENVIAQQLVETFCPRHLVIHDLIDFRSRNHHVRNDPFFRVKVRDISIEEEIREAAIWLQDVHAWSPLSRMHVVRSNHDEALDRWLRETDWRQDAQNAEFYLTLALEAVRQTVANFDWNPLEWAISDAFLRLDRPEVDLNFVAMDESLDIEGIECGIHGHVGPSGARGNPRSYSRLGFKTFTAHLHTPSIVDGCYTVGVLGHLEMEYNRGPSKWMHAHGLIYPNGKRAFLFSKNGVWRLPLL